MDSQSDHSPVTLYITFGWNCPNCSRENAVRQEALEHESTLANKTRDGIPLVPEEVKCEYCLRKWNTM